ncbi:hypothetical protein GM3708_1597 [Geminocystis sp. NIES-3708]|nr:hypothetical protein GM3708_1597 [Geminocystis sp. NIES-3708]
MTLINSFQKIILLVIKKSKSPSNTLWQKFISLQILQNIRQQDLDRNSICLISTSMDIQQFSLPL